jgi:predicted HicB family RNase H-like nuclease
MSGKEGEKMTVSKAQQKAVNKYMKENYDRINLTVDKGMKDTIKAHAERMGESVNGFINRAISEAMEREAIFNEI